MDRTQTAALLTVVSSYDRRQLAEADVLAWHEALADLDPDACRAAEDGTVIGLGGAA